LPRKRKGDLDAWQLKKTTLQKKEIWPNKIVNVAGVLKLQKAIHFRGEGGVERRG